MNRTVAESSLRILLARMHSRHQQRPLIRRLLAIRRAGKTLAAAALVSALAACGGGSDTPELIPCPVHLAAWVTLADESDHALTTPAHGGLTDAELFEVGRIHARIEGFNPDAVRVGFYAFCEE